eukprot:4611880-Alexandrium_andersonii.AAC.1
MQLTCPCGPGALATVARQCISACSSVAHARVASTRTLRRHSGVRRGVAVSYTHLTLPTICSV